jgi:acetyl-CoA carboxylase biotin carboxylase subunit
MGDKSVAKDTVRKAGVPIVPGSEGPVESEAEALKVSRHIGYPVIIKAVNGGGGRGMRIAHNDVSLAKEFHMARGEAEKTFGSAAVYIEKYIERPRHIEFQILADSHGKTLHLGERDCSVQRRHQKLIEEAPSPFMTADLRKKMGKAAIRAAEASEYENAGTVEFIVDPKGHFFFIEMNTRIQVEHPVTEEVTGLNLIKLQISIASGEKLDLDQGDITWERHAIECRINAEDPARNFAPSPGTIGLYYAPGGHGVRVDSHIYSGYTIPPYYDSMIGKLICSGRTRKIALERTYSALSEYLIRGIKTTIPLHKAIVADPVFIEGNATTSYLQEFLNRTTPDLLA